MSTIRKGLPGKITSAVGNLGSLLTGAGRAVVQGLLDGVNAMWGTVKAKFNELTGLIPDWKGPASRDATLLYDTGRVIIGSLLHGIDDTIPQVQQSLAALTDSMGNTAGGAMRSPIADLPSLVGTDVQAVQGLLSAGNWQSTVGEVEITWLAIGAAIQNPCVFGNQKVVHDGIITTDKFCYTRHLRLNLRAPRRPSPPWHDSLQGHSLIEIGESHETGLDYSTHDGYTVRRRPALGPELSTPPPSDAAVDHSEPAGGE